MQITTLLKKIFPTVQLTYIGCAGFESGFGFKAVGFGSGSGFKKIKMDSDSCGFRFDTGGFGSGFGFEVPGFAHHWLQLYDLIQ